MFAEADTPTASRYVADASRLAALESDIRRALREAEHAEPTLEETAVLARCIAANSWSVRGLLDSCRCYGRALDEPVL